MNNTKQYLDQQEAIQLQNRIVSFIRDFKIGTPLHKNGIRKLRGVSPLTLFSVIFSLPFEGVNFSRGIARNSNLGFSKDAAYDFLKNPRYNWRKFMLGLAAIVVRFIDVLTSEEREKVLIFDDSTYDRSRSKAVELLSWILFSALPVTKRNGCRGSPRKWINDAVVIKDGLKPWQNPQVISKQWSSVRSVAGIEADYILMDSWFCFPVILATLGQHLPVICMAKDMKTVLYQHKGQRVRLSKLYSLLRKRPGKAKILTSAVVETKPPKFWINLQRNYDLWKAENNSNAWESVKPFSSQLLHAS